MMTSEKSPFKLSGKKIILILVAWFVLCLLIYIFINIWERNRRQELIKTGVSISKDISSQSGLLLLERDINRLSRLIDKITEKPEVVFASIIDHKNKIIAYTDQEQFFTLNRKKSGVLDDVHYWRVTQPNNQRGMTFSSEVTFSSTKVGEVLISLSAGNIGQLQYNFFLFAGLSLLVIVLFFGITNYKDFRLRWPILATNFKSPQNPASPDSEDTEFFCPLCGKHENFSKNRFRTPDLEKFSVLKQYPGVNPSVLLSDLSKVEELSWLKRLMVAQCTKIINKIAAD